MHLVGHNIINFDVPYLIRWSMLNEVKVPVYLTHLDNKFNRLPSIWVDTMDMFSGGEYKFTISLDNLSRYLGLDGKNGNGKYFYQLPREDQDEYLTNDIIQTRSTFLKMNKSVSAYNVDRTTYFDIETAPKAEADIMKLAPAFDEDAVKLGNVKDPEKVAEKIEMARINHYENILDKAGLHAWYSDPIAIGYLQEGGFAVDLDYAEKKTGGSKGLVERFWALASKTYMNMNELNKN